MKPIQTPLIDIAIQQNGQLRERYAAAKETLTAGEVYNSALADAKCHLADALEKTLEPIARKFVEKYRGQTYIKSATGKDLLQLRDCEPIPYIRLNHCKGCAEKFKKFAHIPEIQEYLAVVAEGALLWDAVEAAKARAISGRKPSVDAKPVDLKNTGTCSICGNLQKLRVDGMAHHGFRISNGNKQYFGRRLGKCFGCSFPPYELSCAGNSAYKPILEHEKAKLETYLHKLVSGQITELPKEVRDMRPGAHWSDKVTVIVKTGEAGWTELYEQVKRRVEWQISGLTSHIARQGALIANWKARPLPSDKK